jgi:hypothetical protein
VANRKNNEKRRKWFDKNPKRRWTNPQKNWTLERRQIVQPKTPFEKKKKWQN